MAPLRLPVPARVPCEGLGLRTSPAAQAATPARHHGLRAPGAACQLLQRVPLPGVSPSPVLAPLDTSGCPASSVALNQSSMEDLPQLTQGRNTSSSQRWIGALPDNMTLPRTLGTLCNKVRGLGSDWSLTGEQEVPPSPASPLPQSWPSCMTQAGTAPLRPRDSTWN